MKTRARNPRCSRHTGPVPKPESGRPAERGVSERDRALRLSLRIVPAFLETLGRASLLHVASKSARGLAQSKTWWIVASVLALLAVAVPARAQDFSIDWFTIQGGGGMSIGGTFTSSGTIGQSDANPQPMSGGNFSLIGGFWSLLAVQTPEAPLLTIRLTTTNTALVLWPSPSTGFNLQQNTDLNTTNWSATRLPW